MAIVVDIISEFSDKGLTTAKGAFNDFKNRVGAAEGAMGKFKAGSTAAMDIVKANATTFALGAGAAIATFAAHGVKAFQDLALQAGEFAATTGMKVEEASRWIEVAGDLGIPVDSVATAVEKLNKQLGANPGLMKDLGDDIAYTNDGGIDVNETFLNVIQRLKDIKDPVDRAKEGTRLFGKGWENVALLVEQGKDSIVDSLKQVSEQKAITPEELKKAREFRDNMNQLGDAAEDLAIVLGQSLIPILTDVVGFFAEGASGTAKFFGDLIDDARQLWKDVTDWSPPEAPTDFAGFHDAIHNNVIGPLDDATIAMEEMSAEWEKVTGELNRDISLNNMEIQLGRVKDSAAKAFGGTREDVLNYKNDVDKAKISLIELGSSLDLQSQKKLKVYVDNSDLEAALGLIKRMGLVDSGQIQLNMTRYTGARATGGAVSAGGTYLVGERGPELLSIGGQGGRITPNDQMGGGGITVNVNGADPNAVVRALQQYVRQSGPVPVNTRAM